MTNTVQYNFKIDQKSRNNLNKHDSFVVWFTGLSGSGKSTLAHALEEKLFQKKLILNQLKQHDKNLDDEKKIFFSY